MKYYDKLIFELSKEGRTGYSLGTSSFAVDGVVPDAAIPANLRREDEPLLPQVSEVDVVRHYTNLSQMNFGVDTGFYPLGSCTMKYNPKINEEIANMKKLQDELLLNKVGRSLAGEGQRNGAGFAGAGISLAGRD